MKDAAKLARDSDEEPSRRVTVMGGVAAGLLALVAIPLQLRGQSAQRRPTPPPPPAPALPNLQVLKFARRYLSFTVTQSRPLVLPATSDPHWKQATDFLNKAANAQEAGTYLLRLANVAAAKLGIAAGTPLTPEVSANVAREMISLLPDRSIPPATGNEHPLAHDPAFLALRLANYAPGIDRVQPANVLSAMQTRLGVSNSQMQAAVATLKSDGSSRIVWDVLFSLQKKLAVLHSHPIAGGQLRVREFMLEVLDPYFAVLEASLQSGRAIGAGLDAPMAVLFNGILPRAQTGNPLADFVRARRAGQLSTTTIAALMDRLAPFDYWWNVHEDHFFVISRIVRKIPVGLGGIDAVLICQRAGLSIPEESAGQTAPLSRYVSVFEDVLQTESRALKPYIASGKPPTFTAESRKALSRFGLDPVRVGAAIVWLTRENSNDVASGSGILRQVHTTAVHEMKHKFDETNHYYDGQEVHDLEISAYLTGIIFGRAPLDEAEKLVSLEIGILGGLEAREATQPLSAQQRSLRADALRIIREITDIVPGPNQPFTVVEVQTKLREWARATYNRRRQTMGALPALEDFQMIVNTFNTQFDRLYHRAGRLSHPSVAAAA